MVGILVSFWDGLFSGAMLVSGRVNIQFPAMMCRLESPLHPATSKKFQETRFHSGVAHASVARPGTYTNVEGICSMKFYPFLIGSMGLEYLPTFIPIDVW